MAFGFHANLFLPNQRDATVFHMLRFVARDLKVLNFLLYFDFAHP